MVWNKTKQIMKETVADNIYSLWIDPIKCISLENERLRLECPDRFFSAYVEQNFSSMIEKVVESVDGITRTVEFFTPACGSVPQIKNSGNQMRLPNMPAGRSRVKSLHPRYTFDEFMVGESNILAQSACRAVSNGDNSIGPCLFINSSTGLGKSHLTHAVAHHILALRPMTRLHYLTAQQYASELYRGIKNNRMDEFKQKYHEQCDILLIEDVHALTGKKKTQEELGELLDTLIKEGKTVVFTAKCSPRELDGIDTEICSRMGSGLVTVIQSPDLATRRRIIVQKSGKLGLCLAEDHIDFLAQRIKGDVRQIESALIALKAKSQLSGGDIRDQLVEDVVGNTVGVPLPLSTAEISEFVSSQFKVSMKEMCSKSRKKTLAFPRQVAMYLSRKHTDESLADIGKVFNRDHSTVLHSIKVVSGLVNRDSSIEAQIALLSARVKKL